MIIGAKNRLQVDQSSLKLMMRIITVVIMLITILTVDACLESCLICSAKISMTLHICVVADACTMMFWDFKVGKSIKDGQRGGGGYTVTAVVAKVETSLAKSTSEPVLISQRPLWKQILEQKGNVGRLVLLQIWDLLHVYKDVHYLSLGLSRVVNFTKVFLKYFLHHIFKGTR